ncbi:sensor histidine kinase [Amycolatopsis sp. K13G38]|uniref:histidine kinase n=1 Tax=Amycolatopsis acididurans TaxID=2724524 RepID=A0ABX1JFM6_9PSEU|nr:sensor histidine kinase [Amycolatopsis acididurans]NKQ58491.1 sensor histidine kinase [Amycolatopsis acididurans]
MVGDSLIALLFLVLDLMLYVAEAASSGPGKPWYVIVPMDIAMTAPLVFRRRYPLAVAYVVLVIGFVHGTLQIGFGSLTTAAVLLYTLVMYVGRRQALYYLCAQIASGVVSFVLNSQGQSSLVFSIVVGLTFAFCWVLGEFMGARQAYHAEVEARLHLLETERDQASRIAVAEERGRIARELHDVVAHAVSVIVVQADGASYALRSDPDLAERAVQTISHTGREALAELRRLLEVLRNEQPTDGPRIPQPGAESLGELAQRVREAGVPVRLEIEGGLTGLPTGVSLGVYRIVQESLTNTLKHAGPGARALVRVRRSDERVDVEITDDGAGKARALVPEAHSLPGGNGVIGMRERATLYGGSLDVGPAPGGGWRVHASLPVRLAP